jgi:hypothetical protein
VDVADVKSAPFTDCVTAINPSQKLNWFTDFAIEKAARAKAIFIEHVCEQVTLHIA